MENRSDSNGAIDVSWDQNSIITTYQPNTNPNLQPTIHRIKYIYIYYPHTDSFKFSNASGTMNPVNQISSGGEIYIGQYSLSFERIHLGQPFNYKVAVGITGLGYRIQWESISNFSNIEVTVITLGASSFVVEAVIQFISRYMLLNCRYIAYNTNYLVNDFHF